MSSTLTMSIFSALVALVLSPRVASGPTDSSLQNKPAVHLAIMPTDGGESVIVARHVSAISKPCWSPDSQTIAFATDNGSLYTVQRSVRDWDLSKSDAPSGVKKVVATSSFYCNPAWSATYGILFRHTDGPLWRVRPDGSGAGPLTLTAGVKLPENLCWLDTSKDGTLIAYGTMSGDVGVYSNAFDVNFAVAKANVAKWMCTNPLGRPQHPRIVRDEKGTCPVCGSEMLPSEYSRYLRICVAPSSRAVAFEEIHYAKDGGLRQLKSSFYRAKLDGSDRLLLASFAEPPTAPVHNLHCWGANGDELIISRESHLATIRAIEPPSSDVRPYGPTDASCWGAKVSPDGKWIAFLTTKEPMTPDELRNTQHDVINDPFKAPEPPKRTVPAAKKPWVVEPDTRATGRYGILVTPWIQGTSSGHQRIYVYLPGKRDKDEYHEDWKTEHRLFEGDYDVMVNGMVLEKVPVKPGHATRILLGAIKFTGSFSQQLSILDVNGGKVRTIQGGETVSLPIGDYQVKVGTRTVKVEIEENKTTEF